MAVTGRVMPARPPGTSPPAPWCAPGVIPARESVMYAVARPVTRLVAPGPGSEQTPTCRSRAYRPPVRRALLVTHQHIFRSVGHTAHINRDRLAFGMPNTISTPSSTNDWSWPVSVHFQLSSPQESAELFSRKPESKPERKEWASRRELYATPALVHRCVRLLCRPALRI